MKARITIARPIFGPALRKRINKFMATKLNKIVARATDELRHEKGSTREIIVSIEPAGRSSAVVGFRLKGTRETFRIGVSAAYELAVHRHIGKIEKRTKELKKQGVAARSAKARASKELKGDLK